jgi:hypothetical protein
LAKHERSWKRDEDGMDRRMRMAIEKARATVGDPVPESPIFDAMMLVCRIDTCGHAQIGMNLIQAGLDD